MCIIGNEMIVCVFYKRIVYKCTLGTPCLVASRGRDSQWQILLVQIDGDRHKTILR